MKMFWYLYEYDTDRTINGELLLKFLEEISNVYSYACCIVDGFDGGLNFIGDKYNLIINRFSKNDIFTPSEIKEIIKEITVIDWANFYFYEFESDIHSGNDIQCLGYNEIISSTIFSLRIVDSTIIQLFSKEKINRKTLALPDFGFVKSSELDHFNFPE